jgi:NADH-quinone oxidoreductase subunit K
MTTALDNFLVVGAILFVLGTIGFLTRRNLIVMVLSAEMMLHGVSLNLVSFSQFHQNFEGQAFTIFMLTVAACEAGLALALVLILYKRRKSLDVGLWRDLGEPVPERLAEELDLTPALPREEVPVFPRLTPAGRMPELTKPKPTKQETAGRA